MPGRGRTGTSDLAAPGQRPLLPVPRQADRPQGEWINPRTGERAPRKLDAGGTVTIETPPFEEDLALRLVATDRK